MTTDTLSDAALEKRALRYFSDTLGFSKGQIFDDEVAHLARLLRAVRDEAYESASKFVAKSAEFWRGVFPEGMTAEQVGAELHDFRFMMDNVPKVYMAVTGDLLSKPNYHAQTVITAFEDYLTRKIEEAISEAREDGSLPRPPDGPVKED